MGLDISDELHDRRQQQRIRAQTEACEVWPEHWDAFCLFQACTGQMEISLGGMGGVHYMPARSVNVQQELRWLGLPKKRHAETVALFRTIEHEALRLSNERANKKP